MKPDVRWGLYESKPVLCWTLSGISDLFEMESKDKIDFHCGWTLCWTKQIRIMMVPLMKHGLGYLLRTRSAVCVVGHHTVTTPCDSGANWYFDIQIKKPTKCGVLGRRPELSLVCHMFLSSWAVIKVFATLK